MKEKKIKIMDEIDERISALLQETGYNKREARILVFMMGEKEGTSKEIEEATGLRQPEVSIGTTRLVKEKLIQKEKIPTDKKGRPQMRFKLVTDINNVFLVEFRERINREIASKQKNLEEITKLLKKMGGN